MTACGEWRDDDYDVLENGTVVGRILLSPGAPQNRPWKWPRAATMAIYAARRTVTSRRATKRCRCSRGFGMRRDQPRNQSGTGCRRPAFFILAPDGVSPAPPIPSPIRRERPRHQAAGVFSLRRASPGHEDGAVFFLAD
jgi:hypothetical protein